MKRIAILLLISLIFPISAQSMENTADIEQVTDDVADIYFQDNTDTKKQKKQNIKKTATKNPIDTSAESKQEKVTTTKEITEQEKREEERRRYRELEELTELTQKSIALYTDNNLDESLASFLKIPEKMRTAEVWLLMGNILMDKGRKDDAVFMYGRAILTDSTYYKAYYNLANIYLADDKFNMAIDEYKSAVKYNPANPYVYYNMGCAYLKSGDLKKAKYAFIKSIELKNDVADFHYNLAYVLKKLGKEKQAKIYLDNYNKLTGQI